MVLPGAWVRLSAVRLGTRGPAYPPMRGQSLIASPVTGRPASSVAVAPEAAPVAVQPNPSAGSCFYPSFSADGRIFGGLN